MRKNMCVCVYARERVHSTVQSWKEVPRDETGEKGGTLEVNPTRTFNTSLLFDSYDTLGHRESKWTIDVCLRRRVQSEQQIHFDSQPNHLKKKKVGRN